MAFQVFDHVTTEHCPRFVGLTGNQIEDAMRILLIPDRAVPPGLELAEPKPSASKGAAPGFKKHAGGARSAFDALGVQKEHIQVESQKKAKTAERNVLDRLYDDALTRHAKESKAVVPADVSAMVQKVNPKRSKFTPSQAQTREPRPRQKQEEKQDDQDVQIPAELQAELNQQMELIVNLNGEIQQNQQALDRADKARKLLEEKRQGLLRAEKIMSQPSYRSKKEKEASDAELAKDNEQLRLELQKTSESVAQLELSKLELLQQISPDINSWVLQGISKEEAAAWADALGPEMAAKLNQLKNESGTGDAPQPGHAEQK